MFGEGTRQLGSTGRIRQNSRFAFGRNVDKTRMLASARRKRIFVDTAVRIGDDGPLVENSVDPSHGSRLA